MFLWKVLAFIQTAWRVINGCQEELANTESFSLIRHCLVEFYEFPLSLFYFVCICPCFSFTTLYTLYLILSGQILIYEYCPHFSEDLYCMCDVSQWNRGMCCVRSLLCFSQLNLATSWQNLSTVHQLIWSENNRATDAIVAFPTVYTLFYHTSNHQQFLKLFAGLLELQSSEPYHLLYKMLSKMF